ncbi:MAG: DUF5723 family protein [Bacteroides sp.]|nr:DUF5723 family protein [Bacteroides sp.]MCM1095682.1 DUF5723 family protein [Terasakiella sp.]
MKSLAKIALTIIAACCAAGVSAQNTYSGYFLENYNYRFQMNPAMGNADNFVSMPALGNLNVAMRGTLHLSSVLYNYDGRTVLFTNPNIPASEVMSNIKDKNRLGAELKLGVLSAGFKAWGGYNTIAVNAVAGVNLNVPGSFFSLAKEGISNRTYDIEDMSARATAYAEIALGHSRDIKQVPGLRVGMGLKFLVGMAGVDAYFNRAHLTLGRDSWTATTNADIYANVGGFQFDRKTDSKTGREYVSGANLDGDGSIGPNGFGLGFDLGATYRWRDFNFSLAVLDLGFINFSDTKYASTDGDRTVNTDAYIFNPNDDADNSFDREWDRLRGDLDNLYQLTDHGDTGSRTRALGATLNVGVEYTFPLYRKLHFGLLSTTRIDGRYTWSEARVSAGVHPVKCFSADANFVAGTFGVGFGWLLNLHTKGFNLFLGMDHTLGEVSKQFVPLNSNASVNFGINFPF